MDIIKGNTQKIFQGIDELNSHLASSRDGMRNIAFFISSTDLSQDEWLDPLAKSLRQADYNTIALIAPDAIGRCKLINAEYLAFIDPAQLRFLTEIDVFVICDYDETYAFPAASKVLGCCHGFIVKREGAKGMLARHAHYCDGYLLSCPISAKSRESVLKLWQPLLNRRLSQRPGKDFYLIPCGYPRMAALGEKLAESGLKPDSIVYAPIDSEYMPEIGGARIDIYGPELVRALLDNFPEYKIIFRPYPVNLGNAAIKRLCEAFSGEQRFILDDNRDGKVLPFGRGAALITDFSHAGDSFAFTTLRPAFYYQPWIKDRKDFAAKPGGGYAYSLQALLEALRGYLKSGAMAKARIKAERDELAMPPETAFEYIADFLPDFIEGRGRTDWIKIEKRADGSLDNQRQIIELIEAQPPGARYHIGHTAFIACNRKAPLLAAYTLHMGMLYAKTAGIWRASYEYAQKTTAIKRPCQAYGDIDPAIPRRLYELAVADCEAKGNSAAKATAMRLLSAFNANFKS